MRIRKKLLISIGTITTAISPVAAFSCSNPFKIKPYVEPEKVVPEINTFDKGVIYNGANMEDIDRNTVTASASTAYEKADMAGVDNSKIVELRKLRNGEENINWHTTNDNIIDAINDWRYAIWKCSNGEKEAAEYLRDFIKSAPFFEFNKLNDPVPTSDLANNNVDINNTTSGSILPTNFKNFSEAARFSMKSFLDNLDPKYLKISFDGTLGNNPHKGTDFTKYTSYKKMNPVVASPKMMGWAQYRAQQIDWLGKFDDHNWENTNVLMNKENGTYSHYANKPIIWEKSKSGGENYAPITNIKDVSDIPSKISFLEAQAVIWNFVLDDRDATGTIGHRSNLLNPDWKTSGWSLSLYDDDQSVGYKVGLNMQFNENQISLEQYDISKKLDWLSITDSYNGKINYFEMLSIIDGQKEVIENIKKAINKFLEKSLIDRKGIINYLTNKLNSLNISTTDGKPVKFVFKDIEPQLSKGEKAYLELFNVKLDTSDVIGGVNNETPARDILGSGLTILKV